MISCCKSHSAQVDLERLRCESSRLFAPNALEKGSVALFDELKGVKSCFQFAINVLRIPLCELFHDFIVITAACHCSLLSQFVARATVKCSIDWSPLATTEPIVPDFKDCEVNPTNRGYSGSRYHPVR